MSEESIREPDQDKVISLKVGEVDFYVSYGTFQKLKGDFEEKVLCIKKNEYFVDRDGKLFEYILRYLRNEIISFPENFKDGRMLLQEAKFFGQSNLEKHLSNGAGEPEVITLLAMVTGANPTPQQLQHQDCSMDISISWMGKNSNATSTLWKDLFQGFRNKLNFAVHEVEGFSNYDCHKALPYNAFNLELGCSNVVVVKPYILNVKDFTSVSILLSGFMFVGFTLLMDKCTDDTKLFNKRYSSVRELILRRIKPILNEETATA